MAGEYQKDISVVVPLYNESESLKELAEELTRQLSGIGEDYELIFINDGSKDSSLDLLRELELQNKRIKVLFFRRNSGKSQALALGFKNAKGRIIITMDADLQDDPQEIPRFISKIEEGYDLVTGWKFNRKDPLEKRFLSKVFNSVVSAAGGIRLHDFNCGFKAYRHEVIECLNIYGELHRFIPVMAYWLGFKVCEIKVNHRPRKYGRSKYGSSRILKGFFDFITVLFMTKFNKRPLHFFGLLGLFCLIPGFLINVYFGILWISTGQLRLRPVLMFGWILLVLGIQFFSIGLLGEMICNMESHKQNEK